MKHLKPNTKHNINNEFTHLGGGVFGLKKMSSYKLEKGLGLYEKNYVHIMDDSSRIAMVRIGDQFPDDINDAIIYILEDQIGSSVARLSKSGTVIDREEYYPFGDSSLRTFTKKRYRYTGKEKDLESGLYYYGARYYSAWTCRFVSIDPLAADYPFYTPYNYAGNKPVNRVDIDGMQEGEQQTSGATAEDSNSGGGNPPPIDSSLEGYNPDDNATTTQIETNSGISYQSNQTYHNPSQDKTSVDTDGMVNRGAKTGDATNSIWAKFFSDMGKLLSSGFRIQVYGSAGDSSQSPGTKIGWKEDVMTFDFGEASQKILDIIAKVHSNKMVNKEKIDNYKDYRKEIIDQLDAHGHDGEAIIDAIENEIAEMFLNG